MAVAARSQFASTRWSVVLAARGGGGSGPAREALGFLCETYWYPVYAFIRRRGHDADAAADLTQGFFTRLLEKGFLAGARQERGRFRSYLLGALQHYLANERDRERAGKRGGGRADLRLDLETGEIRYRSEAADARTPEAVYERRWALAVLDSVLVRLEREYENAGKAEAFHRLKPFLTGEGDRGSYARLAQETSTTEGAVKVAVHRLRRRYRDVLRAEIAQTVGTPDQIDAELRHLLSALAG